MMSKRVVSASIVLDKSPNQVFHFVTDVAYYPFWSDIRLVEKVSGTGEVGTVYRFSSKTLFGKESALVEVSAKEAPLHFAFQDKTKSFISEFGYRIEALDNQTKLTVYHQAQVRFFSGFLSSNPITGVNTELSLQQLLTKLKAAF